MVYFHYKNIHTARSFFSFHTTKAVQQVVSLIATHLKVMIKKIKMQCRKGFNKCKYKQWIVLFRKM